MAARLALLAAAAARAHGAINFYVSPTGSNSNSGLSPATPFATLDRALAAVVRPLTDAVNIVLASGIYYQGAVLNITQGGDATHALSIVGPTAPAAPAIISGGQPLSGWQPLAGVPGVYQTTLPEGVLPAGVVPRSLWTTDAGSSLPRRQMAHTLVNTYESFNVTGGLILGPGPRTWSATPEQLSTAYVMAWQCWTSSQAKVAGYDPATTLLSIEGSFGGDYLSASGSRYAVWNINDTAQLDEGEFIYEPQARRITYAAMPGEDPTTGPALVAEGLPTVLALTGQPGAPITNVHFIGVSVAHSAAVLEQCLASGCNDQSAADLAGAAVTLDYATQVTLAGVEVAHTGGYALWAREGCSGVSVTYSYFHDLGAGGVRVGVNAGGVAVPGTETLSISVTDSQISDSGWVVQAGAGILLQQASDSLLTHNNIRRLLYTGVSTGWTWGYAPTSNANIETSYNDIRDIFQGVLSDGGCYYNLGRSPGTLVHHNLCQGVNSWGYGGWGLYTDEGSSNVTYSNNVVFNTKSAGLHQHYGTDNLFSNNIFALPAAEPCGDAPGCDNAGVRSSQHGPDHSQGMNSSFTFSTNIVYLNSNLSEVFYTTSGGPSAPYSGMTNMTLANNTYWSTAIAPADLTWPPTQQPETWAQWHAEGKDVNSVLADPLFAGNSNFSVLPGSPALALGFVNIDLSTVGPRPQAEQVLRNIAPLPAQLHGAAAAAAKAMLARIAADEAARAAAPQTPRFGAVGSRK